MTVTDTRTIPMQGCNAPEACGPNPARTQGTRRYVYCLIDGDEPGGFGPMGIEAGVEVVTIHHEGISAVVSDTSTEKFDISRGNALAHQRVMEAAMQRGHTVLPVRFNTIAEPKGQTTAPQRVIGHVLVGRGEEVRGLLSEMAGLVELGVKGLWTDVASQFLEIVEGNPEISALRKKLLAAKGSPNMPAQMKLGEKVKEALEARKGEREAAVVACLAAQTADLKKNKTFGDPMFANLAILVDKTRQAEVEAALTAYESRYVGQVKMRCVGPLPPCNFLELVITWDD